MLDQCILLGEGEIRVYPIFYLPQEKARPARGTGSLLFGDLGLEGKGGSKRVSHGWQSGLSGGKLHHSLSSIVISVYFFFLWLMHARL